ncbi:hypothetical protein [Streptomyces sp. NPDC015350]|uniref:hypothetical protein n=1 Tax=Streptomyces sp. NPDC015350 TaxID=3364955 RepID=UPI0036F948E1
MKVTNKVLGAIVGAALFAPALLGTAASAPFAAGTGTSLAGPAGPGGGPAPADARPTDTTTPSTGEEPEWG